MNWQKKKQLHLIFLFIFLFIASLQPCFSKQPDFMDYETFPGAPVLKIPVKIPVGMKDKTIHHVILPAGTLLHDLALKISKKREEVGLSHKISLEEQKELFQKLPWQIAQVKFTNAPLPAMVTKVFAHKGQQVLKGTPLCVLECMKMEMLVRSHFSGDISHIFIEKGKVIGSDDPLIAIMPSAPEWEDIDLSKFLKHKKLMLSFFPWASRPPFPTQVILQNSIKEKQTGPIKEEQEKLVHSQSNNQNQKEQLQLFYSLAFGEKQRHLKAIVRVKAYPPSTQAFHQSINKMRTQMHKCTIEPPHFEKRAQLQINVKDVEKTNKREWKAKSLKTSRKELDQFFTLSWAKWLWGLFLLSKFFFPTIMICCFLLHQSRKIRSYTFSSLNSVRYLQAADINKQTYMTNRVADNMNHLRTIKNNSFKELSGSGFL